MTNGLGPAPRLPVPGIAKIPPYVSLITAVDIEPNVPTPGDPDGMDWLNGTVFREDPTGPGGVFVAGYDSGSHAELTQQPTPPTADVDTDVFENDPFTVYAEQKRSTFGFTINDYIGRARRKLAVTEGYQVEREFYTGTARAAADAAGADPDPTQYLNYSGTTVLNSGTALPIGRALSELQQAMVDITGGAVGMIHGPSGIYQPLVTLMLVTPVPVPPPSGVARPLTRVFDTKGNVVVPGNGYLNKSPAGVTATAGQFWMYGTNMVRIRRSDVVVVPDTYAQALDRVVNDIDFRAERTYLVEWDRSVRVAVLADAHAVAGF